MPSVIENLRLFSHIRHLISSKRLVTITLMDGEKINVIITDYDDYGLIVKNGNRVIIVPLESIALLEWEEAA